jgi:hypothetical protein
MVSPCLREEARARRPRRHGWQCPLNPLQVRLLMMPHRRREAARGGERRAREGRRIWSCARARPAAVGGALGLRALQKNKKSIDAAQPSCVPCPRK